VHVDHDAPRLVEPEHEAQACLNTDDPYACSRYGIAELVGLARRRECCLSLEVAR
jgi:hypothetical protein